MGSIFFQSLQLILENRIFEPKSNAKNNPNINTPAWNLSSLIEFYLLRTFLNK